MIKLAGLLLCAFALWAGASLVGPQAAQAVIDDEHEPTEGKCPLSAYNIKLEGNLVVVGLPFTGSAVKIDATSAKLVGTKATAARVCDVILFSIPRFRWSVESSPAGQSATIANAGTLAPSLNVGGAGAYRIRLTACSPNCRLTLNGRTRTIGPSTREVTINAIGEFAPPPESEPLLPPLSGPATPPPSFSYAERKALCLGDGGVQDPQWVTAGPFGGAGDYRLVEGAVVRSKVPRQDNFLNHDSQDHNWDVKPDPPYFGLPHPDPRGDMEMEWETNQLPREFRPTAGDRASTVGYWIFDCGHEPFRAEIHPPVGLAVERARAVQIPSSFRPPGFPNGFGSNVQVPGIVADIWFNRRSGETTNNCSDTGLHKPPVTVQIPGNQPRQVRVAGPCVREPHPLNRTFRFNVYLPRNPRQRARELGLDPPAVPLFTGTQRLSQGSGGPEPTVVVREQSGVSWLEVTIDLSTFTGTTYARRVSAAWAYPQPDNWGARRWRVRLKSMKIIDDAEPAFDDGDWRFFFNTNNRDREWTRVFSCDGCIDDGDTRNLNVETGGPGLGPDPVLFPGQRIIVHTGGFDDETFGDDIGTVFLREAQRAGDFTAYSQGGDGVYHLNVGIREGPPVGRALLTPEASALIGAYTVRAPGLCTATQAQIAQRPGVRPPCAPTLRDPNLLQTWHPDGLVLRNRVLREEKLELFESEQEEYALTGISAPRLRRLFDTLRPPDRERLLDEIRQELRAVPRRLRVDFSELVTTLDRSLPDNLVDRALPRGFRRSVRPLPLRRR